MRIKGEKKAINEALARVVSVADPKSPMPALGNVLVVPGPQGVQFIATNLQIASIAEADADVTDCAGEFFGVSARGLADVVKSLPGDVVTMEMDGESLVIKAGRSRFRLPTMAGDDFPKIPRGESAEFREVDAGALLRLLDLVRHAAATDDTRPHMAGIHVEASAGRVTMRATDSQRAARASADVAGVGEWRCMIPFPAVATLRSALDGADTAEIAVDGAHMHVRVTGCDVALRLADETAFPPLDRVMGNAIKASSSSAVVPRSALSDAIKRVSLVAAPRDKVSMLGLTFAPESMTVTGANRDVGEGSDEVQCSYDGEPREVCFSPRFMLDMLAVVGDDEAHIGVGGEIDPIMVHSEAGADFDALVMPMRPGTGA